MKWFTLPVMYLFFVAVIFVTAGFVLFYIDTDRDGLTDREEVEVYSTNPEIVDTDEDGFDDSKEVFHGYSPTLAGRAPLTEVTLAVPYVSEAPEGVWSGPWINGCEESSITMIEYYYRSHAAVSIPMAKENMQKLFAMQDEIWGSNADADAYRTDYLITHQSSFNSEIVTNPTLEQIKTELQQKRPVISFHYGKDLHNPNIPFATYGSYYHVIVLIGYDDETQEFIAHDNGDHPTGEQHRYSYDTIMNSLGDFNFETRQVDGKPTVIFTSPRFARTAHNPRVYYIQDGHKHYVTAPAVFEEQGWPWDAIFYVEQEWLDQFPDGEDITRSTVDR